MTSYETATANQPTSDAHYDISKFERSRVSEPTVKLIQDLSAASQKDVKWWEVGAAQYRRLRAEGQTAFPPPVLLDRAITLKIPSRQPGRDIACRVIKSANDSVRGVFLHFHGGGFVLGSAKGQDLLLSYMAETTGLVFVSVEYRLAPEYVYPAAIEDCEDAADWLVANSAEKFQGELCFLGGESAGATLAASTILHLKRREAHGTIRGVVLNYGCFDFSMLSSIRLTPDGTPILASQDAQRFLDTYLNNMSCEDRKKGNVSPLYNDLTGLCPAIFIVGTEDALVDDSVLMYFRWLRSGNEAVLKFVTGAPHGFMVFDGSVVQVAETGWRDMVEFLQFQLEKERH
ncbi:uncharacterized protein Z520_07758 [Fonsecaea multimorphosa CBS 102226]|uniref:Alpha/beta hydrolase fold-3 domain-containing protein n=1 Tax=Fonsecaea multimorphosa CBS 102226 TaxID=1442371 RepID=A0A0D2JSP7_9EURO|nr:uncharacterized protein Z520_07758 [Fonsecaea multimorphosa CBS 102226]KIX96492.1 hypothetical protein Z520_07758 [Fonsecaea multimorphosa CBS 102226]OAL28307.1 hypothetical protein AYO22_03013 [Fonsecaea multimorphosa]